MITHYKNIIIADDHPLILEGNKKFLTEQGFSVLATARNGNEAYNLIIQRTPHIAILDMDMPVLNGLEVAEHCSRNKLNTKIVILSLYKREEIFAEVGGLIAGYVLKEDTLEEILECLKEVGSGNTYVSKKVNEISFLNTKDTILKDLTPAEIKVLLLVAKNLTNIEIAKRLFLSKRTIEKHRSNMIQKLKLDSRPQSLVVWTQKHKDKLF